MNGLEEIKNPISCTFNKTTGVKKYEYTETQVNAIEKELKDKEKKDKALEIIKDKRVQVGDLLYSSCLEAYNGGRDKVYRLFQEEYDLLREVLL